MVDTSVPEITPSRVDLEPILVQTRATFEPIVVQEPPFETKFHLPEHLDVEFEYSEGVTPPVSVTTETIPSSAPEIFYRPYDLPLPIGLIAIEEIAKDSPSSTPFHFGTGIHLYPSTPEFGSFNPPSSQVPVESLGELLDRLKMSEQPSTSRNVSSDAARWNLLLLFLQCFLVHLSHIYMVHHLLQLVINH